MQKDKPNMGVAGRPSRHNVEPDSSQTKLPRNASVADSSSLGSKSRKTTSILKDSRLNIVNAASAIKWLTKEELLIEGEDVSTTSLAQALMWLAAGEKCSVEQLVDGIRAVALCLEGCGYGEVADAAVGEIKETAALWAEEAKKVVQTAVDIVVEAAKQKIDDSGKKSWASQLDDLDQDAGTFDTGRTLSYAQMAATSARIRKGTVPIDHDHAAREALKSKRVLIDGIEGVRSATGGLSPAEIVQKANIALTAARIEMDGSGSEPGSDPKAVAAKVLENGGVVLELDTEKAAAWLLDGEVRKVFERNFGGSAKLVDKSFQVVVCFLPVTLRDTLAESIPIIEEDNCVATGTITKCKWLKAPKHWNQSQRFAHAVFSINERLDACAMIQQGIIVGGQRFQVKKLEDFPKRCFKCQRLGHMAIKCVEIHDVCPLCAGAHTSDQCKVLPVNYRCINCTKAKKPANHAVWDRACPSMGAEKAKRDARNPDSQYKYFPSKEAWTWAKKQSFDDESGEVGQTNTKNTGPAAVWSSNARQADKGWAGMRAARTLGDVVGSAEGWKTVGASKPVARGIALPVDRNTTTNQVASGSNITLSQLQSQPNSQRNASTSRNMSPPRGRQSRLGDYWIDKGNNQDADEEAAVGRQVEATPLDDLC